MFGGIDNRVVSCKGIHGWLGLLAPIGGCKIGKVNPQALQLVCQGAALQ